MLNLRDGERRHITELLEAVVYSESGTPCMANEFEINFGGMRVNADIDYKCGLPVVVQLFMDLESTLDLNGVFLRCEDDKFSVVKFDPLSINDRRVLSKLLQ